jgi:hypothetical protein
VPKETTDPALGELRMIRKLLVLALLRSGITQGQLGGILGMSQSDISRMFPTGALAAFKGNSKKKASVKSESAEVSANG